MNGIRRALALATFERYCAIVANFALLFVVSRLLTPAELGISVLGIAIAMMFCAGREFVTPTYVIQHKSLEPHVIHTAFTLQLIVSAVIGVVLALGGSLIANVYEEPRLVPFFEVVGLAIFIECIQVHISTLLRRDMSF